MEIPAIWCIPVTLKTVNSMSDNRGHNINRTSCLGIRFGTRKHSAVSILLYLALGMSQLTCSMAFMRTLGAGANCVHAVKLPQSAATRAPTFASLGAGLVPAWRSITNLRLVFRTKSRRPSLGTKRFVILATGQGKARTLPVCKKHVGQDDEHRII